MILGLLILLVLLLIKLPKKSNQSEKPEVPIDNELTTLKVFYKYNEIRKSQVITTYETFACFEVAGYNKEGCRLNLDPKKMSWSCPCQVVKFDNLYGLDNCISCNSKGDYQRSITIKYDNVYFPFKIIFKE